jgi:hypothetical protein
VYLPPAFQELPPGDVTAIVGGFMVKGLLVFVQELTEALVTLIR